MPATTQTALDLIHDPARAAALLHPLRLRIMAELRQPGSAAGLARKLNLPRQKLNYHLRELEQEGYLELQEERRRGNCTERILRTTARSYLLVPTALGALATPLSGEVRDRFSSAYLVAVCARAIRDLATLRSRAAKAGKRLATLTLQTEIRLASVKDQVAFATDLTNAISQVVAKHHNENVPSGRRFQLFLGSYPIITKTEEEAAREANAKEEE